jgi:Zn-dependent peptidase ImmA (M78 family)
MLPEIPSEEFAAALDACAGEVLWEAGVEQPPVDAAAVAERIGLVVACDETTSHRARFVRLADERGGDNAQGTIVVGIAERPERRQWAIAHEIGENVACRVFDALGVDPKTAPTDARELVANHLASCLLLPRDWFAREGHAVDWDLLALKQCFATASHELIARRMLEMRPAVVITLCDLGTVHWRRSNAATRPPAMLPEELAAWRRSHELGTPAAATLDPSTTGLESVRCWPIHEPDWKREILRSEIAEW